MIRPPSGKAGTSSAPITIRAAVDGGVLIDGEFQRSTAIFRNNHWMVLEGINIKNSANHLILFDASGGVPVSNITVRRVVVWDTKATRGEGTGILLIFDRVTNILIEDVGVFGIFGRGVMCGASTDGPITFRRVWIDAQGYMGGFDVSMSAFHLNYSSTQRATCENCLGRFSMQLQPFSHCFSAGSGYPAGCVDGYRQSGPGARYIYRHRGDSTGEVDTDTDYYGSLGYQLATDRWRYNGVQVGPSDAFRAPVAPATRGVTIRDLFIFLHPSNPSFNVARAIRLGGSGGPSSANNVTTVHGSGPDDLYGGLWSGTNRFTGTSLAAVPDPWTTSTGANLCTRYVNRVKTATPLWPWPMNERIKQATAMAGRYTGPCNSCRWGDSGTLTQSPIRSTVDVTAEIESILGSIPLACRDSGTPAPTPILSVSPTSLNFNVTTPVNIATVSVLNTEDGSGAMPWSVIGNRSWISVTPQSLDDVGSFTVILNPATLSIGANSGAIIVTALGASGSPKTINVTANVASIPPTADFSVFPASLDFQIAHNGEAVSKQLYVSRFGGSPTQITLTKSESLTMISISPTIREDAGVFTINASPLAVAAGVYTGTIEVTATGFTDTINVTVTVLPGIEVPPEPPPDPPAPPGTPSPVPVPPPAAFPTPSPSPKFRDLSLVYRAQAGEYTTRPQYFIRFYSVLRTLNSVGQTILSETPFATDFSSAEILEPTRPKIQCLAEVIPGEVTSIPDESRADIGAFQIILTDLTGQLTALVGPDNADIRPGQRVQIFAGYAELPESEYISLAKLEVRSVDVDEELVTYTIVAEDMQHILMANVFRSATRENPVVLEGHPIDIALQVLMSTGSGQNGPYDVLGQDNGLAVPEEYIDIEAFETIRVQTFTELAVILFEKARLQELNPGTDT